MKKLVALLLASAMVIGLAACGQKAAQTAETTAEAKAAETKAAETKAAETKAAETKAATAAAAEVVPGQLPLVPAGEKKTISIGVMQNALVESYDENDFTKWLEETTGVDLEFVFFSSDATEATQQLSLMTASGEKLPDIIFMMTGLTDTAMMEYGEGGYFVDVKPYIDAGLDYYWQEEKAEAEKDFPGAADYCRGLVKDPTNGAIYSMPKWQLKQHTNDTMLSNVYFNQVWLDKLGEQIPRNTEDLHRVLTRFANEDPNGNGKKDEIAFATYDGYRAQGFQWIINAFVYCNDEYMYNSTDGQVWLPYTTDEYREALKYMNMLYSEGLIAPVSFSLTDAQNSEFIPMFTPADQVAITGCVCAHATLTTEADNPVLFEYIGGYPLDGETDKGGYAAWFGHALFTQTAITTSCEDPELAFRLLDFMGSNEAQRRSRYGKLGTDWNWVNDPSRVNVNGRPATIEIYDNSTWSQQNSLTWHVTSIGLYNSLRAIGEFKDDGSWTSKRDIIQADETNKWDSCPVPAEVITKIAYNAEEKEVIAKNQQMLKSYILEARAQFISGVLDPSDDAAWKAYLDACEQQGASECVAATQGAWSRMK